jgi:hypothetical protein
MNFEEENIEKKVDFILDILNLLEIENILPKEIVDRARNRAQVNELKDKLIDKYDENVNTQLKQCLAKEIEYQKKSKEQRHSKIRKFVRQIRGHFLPNS